jgi:hypothetical protein
MEVWLKLLTKISTLEVDATMYRNSVECLCYLVYTRPDVTFTMGFVSYFMERPRQEHLAPIKLTLHYIVDTVDYNLVYPKCCNTDNRLAGYMLIWYTSNDLRRYL